MNRINPQAVFSGQENSQVFDKRYDFNTFENDFDTNHLQAVLSEINNKSFIRFEKNKFRKFDGEVIHPVELLDYFDSVGVEIGVYRSVGGWKYSVDAWDEVVERGAMMPTRSCAMYVAFIAALNYRNSQINPMNALIDNGGFYEVSKGVYKVEIRGLPDIGNTCLEVDYTDKVTQTVEFSRGKINGLFHSWGVEVSEYNDIFSESKEEQMQIAIFTLVNGKKTTDNFYLYYPKSKIKSQE